MADENDYTYSMVFLAFCAFLGFLINLWLLYDDLKYRNGILYKVDKGTEIAELTTSPTGEKRRLLDDDDTVAQGELVANEDEMMANAKMTSSFRDQMKVYNTDADARHALKSSMAKSRQWWTEQGISFNVWRIEETIFLCKF